MRIVRDLVGIASVVSDLVIDGLVVVDLTVFDLAVAPHSLMS